MRHERATAKGDNSHFGEDGTRSVVTAHFGEEADETSILGKTKGIPWNFKRCHHSQMMLIFATVF